jgi:hypothetical protein
VCIVVYCLGSLAELVLGILLLCCISYTHLLYYVSIANCTIDAGLTGQKPVCVYVCRLSCVSWRSYLKIIVVFCDTMGVLLLSYICLFTKCSLLFVIRIERGEPASSIRLVVLNSSRDI